MFKEDYRKEMDSLAVDETFRRQTIQLMKEKAVQSENTAKPAKNTVYFRKKKSMRIAASVAVLLISAVVGLYAAQDYFIGTDQSANDTVPPTRPQQEIIIENSKNKPVERDYDALPQKARNRIYTIREATSVNSSVNTSEKVVFNTETSGSYGFEGYLLYDISQLATNNPFDENAVLDVLPVYEFSSMTNEDIKEEFDRILQNTGMTEDDINYTEFQWVEIIDDGQQKVIDKTISTDTAEKPSDTAQLYTIDIDMTGGYVEIRPARSQVTVSLYDDRPDDPQLTGQYVMENYRSFTGENTAGYLFNDYNIYGEQDFFPHYVYSMSEDYGQNIFNYSIGSTVVWHSDEMWQSKNDKGENIRLQYTPQNCYTLTDYLPAISWQQALGMLYEGKYLSTLPEPLPEDTAVAKIEMVYKEPPYYAPADYKSGLALPFYKFYIERPQYNHATEIAELKNYAVYYVCAIHPDYVEYTDGYLNFN